MSIGEKIKIYRGRENLTQSDLAERVGVSIMTLRRWEWGERIPRANEMSKLAEALGTTVGALMGEGEPEASDEKENAKNLPINNAPENENSSDDLDLGFWGGVAEKASRAARSKDSQKLSLVAALLRSALDAITGAGVNLAPQVVGVNGSHNKVRDIVNVATA